MAVDGTRCYEMKTEPGSSARPADLTHDVAKLSDLVYAKIAARIRSGEYPLSSRLPPEQELAELLSVSRPVVREALARLRSDGVVRSRRGSGTYVCGPARDTEEARPASLTSIADLRRCMEFRVSLEGESAYHAARGTEGDRTDLVEAMRRLEESYVSPGRGVENDLEFHRAIAVATGNRFFRTAMDQLEGSVVAAMGITPSFAAPATPERRKALHAEHSAIYEAIMANDAEGARTALRTHLENAIRRIFEGTDS